MTPGLRPPRVRLRGRLLCWLIAAIGPLAATNASARDYYVATTGNDANAGTIDQPFATLPKGVSTAVAGDTVYIRGGVYMITAGASATVGISFSKSGTSDTARIRYWAYPGESPVFDFSQKTTSATAGTTGFVVGGSWLHFKGIEIRGVPMQTRSSTGVGVSGHDDIFELLNIHHIAGAGFFVNGGTGGHVIINSDSHDNYDPNSDQGDGQNADGFGVHYGTTGNPTRFWGCRAWWNSDDGWDFINHDVPVITENSWSMGNGYSNMGMGTPADGNGNGFKVGSSDMGVRHVVKNCVAFRNKASGFYANHSSGGNDWFNNTSFMNGTQFNMRASPPGDPNTTIVLAGDKVHHMRNNIGFPNRNSYMDGVDTMFNAWDLALTPANGDFASVDYSAFMGPRQADGSLPDIPFMKLIAGSKFIDKGTDVGIPFVGAAPDLGAYEFGATGGASGTGGMIGAGGASGTGGASGSGSGGTTASSGAGGSGSGGVAGGTGGASSGGATGTGTGATGGTGPGATGNGEATGGCACRASGAGTAGGAAIVLLAVAALAVRRRRRAASPRPRD